MKISENLTPQYVEQTGQGMTKVARKFMVIGLCGLAIFVLVLMIAAAIGGGQSILYALAFYQAGAAVFFLPLSYLMILLGIIGIPLYFSGLNLFALGRIAINTEKDKND